MFFVWTAHKNSLKFGGESLGIPIAWYKARLPGFPRKSMTEGASSLVWQGSGSPKKVSCSKATLRLHRCNLGVALEQETFLGLPEPCQTRLLAPSVIDFRGNPGIRAFYPEGPGIEKIHSRSNAWKNHSPTHEIFILAWNLHSRFEIFILDWKFQSQALFFCGQRGARNENFILDWEFHSVSKAWFFQDRLSRLNFFNPGALWVPGNRDPKRLLKMGAVRQGENLWFWAKSSGPCLVSFYRLFPPSCGTISQLSPELVSSLSILDKLCSSFRQL